MWPKRRRGRKVFLMKVKLRPGSRAYSEGAERGMQGRLCRDDTRLGGGGGWLLIQRYWGAMAGF